jgi:hypothetical protein
MCPASRSEEGRPDICRAGTPHGGVTMEGHGLEERGTPVDQQNRPQPMEFQAEGVMFKRPSCCAARLGRTAPLPGAARHTLPTF